MAGVVSLRAAAPAADEEGPIMLTERNPTLRRPR
jgi:hypothetical protein